MQECQTLPFASFFGIPPWKCPARITAELCAVCAAHQHQGCVTGVTPPLPGARGAAAFVVSL